MLVRSWRHCFSSGPIGILGSLKHIIGLSIAQAESDGLASACPSSIEWSGDILAVNAHPALLRHSVFLLYADLVVFVWRRSAHRDLPSFPLSTERAHPSLSTFYVRKLLSDDEDAARESILQDSRARFGAERRFFKRGDRRGRVSGFSTHSLSYSRHSQPNSWRTRMVIRMSVGLGGDTHTMEHPSESRDSEAMGSWRTISRLRLFMA